MAQLDDIYKEIEVLQNEIEVQKRRAEYWEGRWKHEYSEKIELLHETIELKRQYEGIPEEVLAMAQGKTFTKNPEKTQMIEIARAQVKGFHSMKRGVPSENQSQEQGE